MRDARQTKGGGRRRWDGGKRKGKPRNLEQGSSPRARGRTCALAVSQTILIDLDAAQTVARSACSHHRELHAPFASPVEKIEKKCFSWLAARRSFFPTIGRRFAQRSRVALAFYLVPPLAVSESPTRETPLHPARLPPSSRARRHVRAHRANVSRESSNEHARARFPAHRALDRPGRRFLAFRPSFGTSPRAR